MSKKSTSKVVEEIQFSFGDLFIFWTSIFTFIFTGIYISLRSTILKSGLPSENSLNDIILDTGTSTPVSTLVSALIGAIMIFKSLREKLESHTNEIRILQQEINDLKQTKVIDTNQETRRELPPIKPVTKPKSNEINDIKPEH